jgi:VanZ family protein
MFGVSVLISDLWTSDLWLGVIFVGSTNVMSTEQTSRLIAPFLRWLNPDISTEVIAQIQFVVRKAAYVGEYAILAILFWRALHGGANLRMKMSILFIAVLSTCTLFAASDEFHQSFVSSRTTSVHDMMIDMCGAIVGLMIC